MRQLGESVMLEGLNIIIAEFLWKTGAIKISIENPFQLTSGKYSPLYIDCRVLISFPYPMDILTTYAHWLYEKRDLQADYIAGGETAGIPFAAWLAERLKKPFVYVRKKPKGHGLTSQIEGSIIEGKTILLYEDLITDGQSKLNFIDGIRNAGCMVTDCLVLLDRQEGGKELLQKEHVALISLVTLDDCFEIGLRNKYLTTREFDVIKAYMKKGTLS
jgi:orotate phosphoribosyltransferase